MIMQQFYRPGRLKNVKRSISYTGATRPRAAEQLAEVQQAVKTYWGRESLEKWLATRFVALTFRDPNAFIVTEFAAFDSNTTKAKPYPVEYGSDEAILFSYANNVLQYLVVLQSVQSVDVTGKLVTTNRYTMYLENDIIVATQLPKPASPSIQNNLPAPAVAFVANDALPANGGEWAKDSTDRYVVNFYQPRGGRVQAMRVGYLYDEQTDARTFVGPLETAVPIFKKAMRETSEMDLSIALHVFPQKAFYAQPCPGMPKKPCLGGITDVIRDGEPVKCQRCLGSGVVVHKTAQDALAVPMPQSGGPTPAVQLKDMIAYFAPPVELLNFMDGHLRNLRTDAIDAVFNSGISSQQQAASSTDGGGDAPSKTATEVVVTDDRADNTLAPFTDQCSAFWRYTVELIAEFLDNGGPDLRTVCEYPSSNRIKTYKDLIADRKEAVDAGLPHYFIQEIDRQVAEMLFDNDPLTLQKIQAKTYFTPFLGKTTDEVEYIFSNGKARELDIILWAYVDTIFDELGEEQPGFWDYTRAKQWEYILPKLTKIISELEPAPVAVPLSNNNNPQPEPQPEPQPAV